MQKFKIIAILVGLLLVWLAFKVGASGGRGDGDIFELFGMIIFVIGAPVFLWSAISWLVRDNKTRDLQTIQGQNLWAAFSNIQLLRKLLVTIGLILILSGLAIVLTAFGAGESWLDASRSGNLLSGYGFIATLGMISTYAGTVLIHSAWPTLLANLKNTRAFDLVKSGVAIVFVIVCLGLFSQLQNRYAASKVEQESLDKENERQEFLENHPEGLFVTYHENGEKSEEGFYDSEGKLDGVYVTWNSNGQKRSESRYAHGVKTGIETYWHGQGKKHWEYRYSNGVRTGPFTSWYYNGQVEKFFNYRFGKKDGLETTWHRNGQKKSEVNYSAGNMNGTYIEWHDNGQKKEEGIYVVDGTNSKK